MQITELAWRLIILFFPGVIATLLVRSMTQNKPFSNFYFVIISFTLGIFVFLFMEIGLSLKNIAYAAFDTNLKLVWGTNLEIWDALMQKNKAFPKEELLIGLTLSIPIGILIGSLLHYGGVFKILSKIGVISRFDGDTFYHFLTYQEVEWIILRDYNTDIAYFGKIKTYSESFEDRGVVLEQVSVFDNQTWELKYESKAVFLELKHGNFSIELPVHEEKESNNEGDNEKQQ